MTPIPLSGSSMFPYLRSGDQLLVDMFEKPRALSDQDQIGEIFLYRCPNGEWVCHRFLGQTKNNYFFKGDWTYQLEIYNNIEVWGKIQGKIQNGKISRFEKFWALSVFCFLQRQMRLSQWRPVRGLSRIGVYFLGSINRFWRQ
ncbi:MAG: S24/S26 family peptidase [Bdellovibrionales bacterium]|nr:S24/S26 family peptidase [Bdellovibrionales bacterium]